MKKNVWNRIKLLTLAGAMSLALLGCGGTGGTKEGDPVQEEQPEDLNSPNKEKPANGEEQPESPEGNSKPEEQADNTGAQEEEAPPGRNHRAGRRAIYHQKVLPGDVRGRKSACGQSGRRR